MKNFFYIISLCYYMTAMAQSVAISDDEQCGKWLQLF
jgi:hypothetical protein